MGNFSVANISIIDKTTNQSVLPTQVYIGNLYVFTFVLIHHGKIVENNETRYSSCHIENATLNITLSRQNTTWFLAEPEFNHTKKLYIADIYIDPNIPVGQNNITIRVFIPFSVTWYNFTIPITILGTLHIVNEKFPGYAYIEETYNASFQLMCPETNRSIANVSLLSEVTFIKNEENETIYVPVSVFNYSYTLSFIIRETKQVLIKIIKTSDNTTIGVFLLSAYEKSPFKFSVDPWQVIPPLAILLAYIGYILIRTKYSREISRRFLIERAKKFA